MLFDLSIYVGILRSCDVKLSDVHACEINVLSKIDITVFSQPLVYDCVRDMYASENVSSSDKAKLLTYIDNYMCYVLVSADVKTHIALHCVTAALFFHKANRGSHVEEHLASAVSEHFSKKQAFSELFDRVVDELTLNLKTLGNDAKTVETIAAGFASSRFFTPLKSKPAC